MSGTLNQIAIARALFDLAAIFGSEFNREVPLNHLLAFFRIAMAGDEGMDQGELQKATGFSSATTSRTVRALSRVSYDKRREGYDVIEFTLDPLDNRRRLLRITPKGKALIEKLAARVQLESSPLQTAA